MKAKKQVFIFLLLITCAFNFNTAQAMPCPKCPIQNPPPRGCFYDPNKYPGCPISCTNLVCQSTCTNQCGPQCCKSGQICTTYDPCKGNPRCMAPVVKTCCYPTPCAAPPPNCYYNTSTIPIINRCPVGCGKLVCQRNKK